MKPGTPLVTAAILIAALAVVATADQGGTVKKPQQARPMVTEAKSAPVTLGSPKTAAWTATTWEAATTEAHRRVLESGHVATVTGEVVDVSCYLQLGKRGEGHVACGSKCIANGQPIGIVDAEDRLTIIMAEEHHPRRDGQVELKSVLGPLLAKTVTVTGMLTEMSGYRALFVQAAELGGAVQPEAAAGGK